MDDLYYQLSRFGAALDLIRNHYVDPPDEAKLIEAALKAMAASLDPHSGYVSGEAYRLLQSRIKGEFAGCPRRSSPRRGRRHRIHPDSAVR